MKTQGSVLEQCISTFLILFTFSLISEAAFAHPVVQYWENRGRAQSGLHLEPRVSFFSTQSNYDSSSQIQSLPNGASVTQIYLDLNLAYGISDHLFLLGRLSALSVKVSNPQQRDLTALGLGDQLLGASYRFQSPESGLGLRVQFDATLPAYQNSAALNNGSAYLGDESIDLTTGGFLEIPFVLGNSKLSAELGAAYLYRSKGYSSAVPFSFFIRRIPSKQGFLFSAGTRGQISLKNDVTAQSPFTLGLAQQESNRGAAGSALINAINPSWWVAQGTAGYQNAHGQSYTLTLAAPFLGTNVASGLQVSAGAQFALNYSSSHAVDDSLSSGRNPRRKLAKPQGFATYNLDAKVTSVNDQLYLVKIDQGSSENIERGQIFDIFNGNELISRTKVISVKDDEAALNVIEYYQDHWIETGFTARRLVQMN